MAESVESDLKTRLRTATANERLNRRQETFDKHRNLKEFKKVYNKKDIADAVRNLAHGNTESKHDAFAVLKAAFLQDLKLVGYFMRMDNALHSLVGYILSHDSYIQLLAVECICNAVALEGSPICFKLAKAATPYIMNVLQGCNYPLMDVALQALINMSSCAKTCRLLYSQGVIGVYLRTVALPEISELTAKALVMIFKHLKTIRKEDIEAGFSAVLNLFESSPYIKWLFFLFSTMPMAHFLFVNNGIHMLSLKILDGIKILDASNVIGVTALVRIVGNISSESTTAYSVLKHCSPLLNLANVIHKSTYKFLLKELEWCVGSAVKHIPSEQMFKFKPFLVDFSRLTNTSRL